MTVTPVRTGPEPTVSGPSPEISVVCPTCTPATSVIALRGPGVPRPTERPRSRSRMPGLFQPRGPRATTRLSGLLRSGLHAVMQLSVRDILALPELVTGRPVVVAAEQALDRPVRWVHVAEIADVAPLLRGGELILTT